MKITGKTQAELDSLDKKKECEIKITEAQRYLDETDKKIVRAYETGEPVFQDVLIERAKCREAIMFYRSIISEGTV